MKMKTVLSAVTLAALVAASFSTVAQADAGGRGGDRGGDRGGPMFNFVETDANADGNVTKEEITAYHAAKIAAMDTDKDGNLSAAELIAGQVARDAARQAERGAKMVQRMMERQDANKDGVLSVEEMTPPAGRGDKMFDRIDADGDGAISKAEADTMGDKMGKRGKGRDGEHRGKGKHDRGGRGDRDKG
ncbi:EF-hand domain-containing protein [Pseudorhodobacter ferrugineus]|uniref:EF-hand domain-containing protein n=1 Tax=Pseudorhodobacter ferrugineus TaxID=77008 RepID=UPI0003B6CE72|nr:EF-hand domain-containing protein [Pseudorhodobacter ferrugineus]